MTAVAAPFLILANDERARVTRPGPREEDRAAIEATQKGDREAFDSLVERYQRDVYRLCYRYVGDHHDASDLAQDVFLKAYRAIGRFRGESAFSTWLHRLATNVALMSYRTRGRRERLVAPVEDPAAFDRGTTPKAGEQIDLERALVRLPAGAREVFVLHDMEGFGHAEIGQMLGIAEGTSKAQLFRARRMLRGMLDR